MDELLNRIIGCIGGKHGASKALADYLGIHPNVITNWKNGRNKSYRGYIDEIAKYFNVSENYLLTGEESKEKPLAEAEGDIDAMVESILSDLTDGDGDTLMLDGKPASAKALEYLRESIRANIEHAKRLNEQENG